MMRDEFYTKLTELSSLLKSHGVKHWPSQLHQAAASARLNPRAGAKQFKSFCGGMGSLTDVYVCRANGHLIAEAEEQEVNRKANALRERLYQLASELDE